MEVRGRSPAAVENWCVGVASALGFSTGREGERGRDRHAVRPPHGPAAAWGYNSSLGPVSGIDSTWRMFLPV